MTGTSAGTGTKDDPWVLRTPHYAVPYASTGVFYCSASEYATTLTGTLQK